MLKSGHMPFEAVQQYAFSTEHGAESEALLDVANQQHRYWT